MNPESSGFDPDAADALVALGLRLRQAREASGLAAGVLADRLRIGVEQLEALESADGTRLPEPVFVIAQARRVADALRIDLSTELAALRGSTSPAPSARPLPASRPSRGGADAPPRSLRAAAGRPRRSRRPLLLGAGLLVLLAAGWGGWQLSQGHRLPWQPQPRSAALVPAAGGDHSPAVSTGDRPPQPERVPASSSAAPAAASSPVATATSLLLDSRQPSWVEVRTADGRVLFRGVLRAPRSFPLAQGIKVLAGRPDLVTSRIGAAPARVLGPISDVRWRSLAAPIPRRGSPARP